MINIFGSKNHIRTPTILQMDAAECGAVALSIVAAFYKRFLSPEEVRDAVDVSRDGSKAINIIKAARKYGMHAEGYNIESLEEIKELEFPVIAYWEFDHFLVIEGMTKQKVYLNDPATGPRIISMEEFDNAYTGIILELRPGPDFEKGGKPEPSVVSQLMTILLQTKLPFIFIMLATLALIIPATSIAIISKVFIDDILIKQQYSWFIPLIACMIFVAIVSMLLTYLQQRYALRLSTKVELTGSAKFFWHLLHLPMKFFQQRSSGDIAQRIEVNEEIGEIVSSKFSENIIGIFTMLFYALIMLLLSWPLALINIFLSMFNFVALIYINRQLTDISRHSAQNAGKLNAIETHGIQIIETIKANALEKQYFSRWAAHHAKLINSQQRIEIYSTLLDLLPTLISGLNTVILLSFGTYLIIMSDLTIGSLFALQLILYKFNEPMDELIELGGKIQELKGSMVRLNDVYKHDVDKNIGTDVTKTSSELFKNTKPMLDIKKLTFGYSKLEPPIFEDFSLSIKQGEHVAIVGLSGSGKSSLAKLACGLYKAWDGTIRIKGNLLTQIARADLADYIAIVDQDICLFVGSIRENLTLWDDSIADTNLHSALRDACIDDIVAERGGLDANVLEGGNNFSGGQCQRLEIARALTKNPQLLILDEATSAIDPINEEKIYTNLKARNCTLFIIAHRLSTIHDCDKIVVIDEGEISQIGTHQELVSQPGIYQTLIKLEMP